MGGARNTSQKDELVAFDASLPCGRLVLFNKTCASRKRAASLTQLLHACRNNFIGLVEVTSALLLHSREPRGTLES
jgi:hypothetical protein